MSAEDFVFGRCPMSATPLRVQVAELARRSIVQTLRQPLLIVPPILFPLVLVAVNASGLQAATRIPGFPTDNYVDFAIAVAFIQGALFAMINAGSALARDVETGFLRRLAMTPMQRPALLIGQLTGVILVAFFSALIYLAVGFLAGLHVKAGPGGVLALLALAMLIALGFAAIGALVGLRSGSAEAVQGFFPLFFVLLFLSSSSLPATADRPRVVPDDRDLQPALLPHRGHPLVHHRRVGRPGAGPRVRLRDPHRRARDRRGLAGAADAAGAHMRRFADVAVAIAWRMLKKYATTPSLLFPSLAFPLFFFIAFAGGLSSVSRVPGLRLPIGLHGVPVRLRVPAVGGVRRRVHGLRDRGRLRERLQPAAHARGAEPPRRSSPATRWGRSCARC